MEAVQKKKPSEKFYPDQSTLFLVTPLLIAYSCEFCKVLYFLSSMSSFSWTDPFQNRFYQHSGIIWTTIRFSISSTFFHPFSMNSLIQQFSYLNPSRHFPRSSNMKSFQTASSLSQSSNTDDDFQDDNSTVDSPTTVEVKEESSHDKQSVWSDCDPTTGVCYRRKTALATGGLPKNGSDTQMSELQESCGNSPLRLSNSPPSGSGVASFPTLNSSSFQFFPPTFMASKSVQSSPPYGSGKEY